VIEFRPGKSGEEAQIGMLLREEEMDLAEDTWAADYMVAIDGAEVVGCLRILDLDDCYYLESLAVRKDRRRRGVGRQLVSQFKGKKIVVISRGTSNGFYRSLGFQNSSWDIVPPQYRGQCRDCPDFEHCQPLVLVKC